MATHFFSEDVSFTLDNEEDTKSWIAQVLQKEGYEAESINYIFCSDNRLLALNKEYLNHDTLTDILTFEHSEKGGKLEADIFISVERIRENAMLLKTDFANELHRVIIHGLLHLFGLQDKTEAEKEEMRKKEDACLSLR